MIPFVSTRHRLFAEKYYETADAMEAAKFSGYGYNITPGRAIYILKSKSIQSYLIALINEEVEPIGRQIQTQNEDEKPKIQHIYKIADKNEIQEILTSIARDRREKTRERLTACDLLMKMQGVYAVANNINNFAHIGIKIINDTGQQ